MQKIPVESLQMPQIEDQPVALRYGPVIECTWIERVK
jgi:hypothetical protein